MRVFQIGRVDRFYHWYHDIDISYCIAHNVVLGMLLLQRRRDVPVRASSTCPISPCFCDSFIYLCRKHGVSIPLRVHVL